MAAVTTSKFGENTDGFDVNLYTLKCNKIEVGVINYGAAIAFLKVPDKNDDCDDIVTGFETLEEYQAQRTYFGSTVGRVANRIAKGKFTIDGKEYSVPVNNGPNNLHGGNNGFDKKIWEGAVEGSSVIFRIISPDDDEGFPGQLNVSVSYTLHDDELTIKYQATSDKATPVNLSNHSFFNLSGHKKWETDLGNHEIRIPADEYLPCDENCLVTGDIQEVKNSVFDLRESMKLSEELLTRVPGGGFDHNFCFQRNKKRHLLAVVKHLVNGRVMTVESTEPGVQLYTGNFLSGISGKRGVKYTKHSALCLESQNWPDSINHVGVFPDCILRPGKEYSHTTWLKFETS